jgi:GntR family transcriptional regulator/MocR family aminotransferase
MSDDANTSKNANFDALGQLLSLSTSSDVPLYKQLTDKIIDSIENLRLMPGQLMPSNRDLSKILQVSRNTVLRAYEDLISRGYLKAEEGIGTFTSRPLGGSPAAADGQQAVKLSAMAQRIMQMPFERLSCGFFPELNNGAAPADMVPTKQWRRLMLAFSRDSEIEESDFVNESFGYRPLREAIATYVLRKKGIHCHADQVILFLDAMYSTYAAAQLLIDSGDCVAMEEPGYPYARMCFQLLNAELYPVPVDDQGLKISLLQNSSRKINAVFVTPSHQDPCGGTMPMESRMALLDWAAGNEAIIFEDDYDNDFFYGAPPLPS